MDEWILMVGELICEIRAPILGVLIWLLIEMKLMMIMCILCDQLINWVINCGIFEIELVRVQFGDFQSNGLLMKLKLILC